MASCLANKDKAEAQYQLGIIYYHGLGVRKNLSEAKKWLRKASLRGDASATERATGRTAERQRNGS